MGKFKKKELILSIIIIALIIQIGNVFVFIFNQENKRSKDSESDNIADLLPDNRDIIQEEYLEQGKIYINDIKYAYNGEKFILSLMIENKTSETIDLSNYTIKVLNERKIVLATIGGTALGVIEGNNKMASIIELTDNISAVYELQFVK